MPAPCPSSPPTSLPTDLGGLRASQQFAEARLKYRSVKDELRENLICRLRTREPIFPGIVGYEDTVVPWQIVNAVLSRQNFILLGLRGQAKSLPCAGHRGFWMSGCLTAGCEIRDNLICHCVSGAAI